MIHAVVAALAAWAASVAIAAGVDPSVAANARLPIPVSQIAGIPGRELAPDVCEKLFIAYRSYINGYEVAWREFGVALERLRSVESTPLVLQASRVARVAREDFDAAGRHIADLNREFLDGMVSAGVIDAAQVRQIESEIDLRNASDELSWRLGRVNPGALWDPDCALEALDIAPAVRDALRSEGEAWRSALRTAVFAARNQSADVFERAALLLEQQGWAADTQGRLVPAEVHGDPVEAEKECWRRVSPPVLAVVRRIEELNWRRIIETTRALPFGVRLKYVGMNLLRMSAQVDDGALERAIAGRYVLADAGPELCAILNSHLEIKLGLMVRLASTLSDVRARRLLAIATDIDPQSVQRLEAVARAIHDVNRTTISRLQVLKPDAAVDCPLPNPPTNWGIHERDAARALAPVASDRVAGTFESRRRQPQGPVALSALSGEWDRVDPVFGSHIDGVRDRIASEELPRLAARWESVEQEFKADSDTSLVLDESVVDRYCTEEVAYVTRGWELLAAVVGSIDSGGTFNRAWRARYLVDFAATTHSDPFGGLADAWRFMLLDEQGDAAKSESPSLRSVAYCDRVLPLLEARLRAWFDWRRASLLVHCSDAIAWRIRFQPGHSDLEVEPAIRQRKALQSRLAAATAELRVAELRVIEAVLAIIDERINSGDAASLALRQRLLSRCMPGSEANAFECLLDQLRGHESRLAPESVAEAAIWCSMLTDQDLAAICRRLHEPFEDEGVLDSALWQRVRGADLAYVRDRAWDSFQREQLIHLLVVGAYGSGK